MKTFINNLSKNYKWNLSIIILFAIFMFMDLIAGNYFYSILELFIIIGESFSLKENLEHKKSIEEKNE